MPHPLDPSHLARWLAAGVALAVLVVIAWRRGWWYPMARVHVTLLAVAGVGWAALLAWAWLS